MVKKIYLHFMVIFITCVICFLACDQETDKPIDKSDEKNEGNSTVVPGQSLSDKLYWLQTNANSNNKYTIEVSGYEQISSAILSFNGKNNIIIIIKSTGAERIIEIASNGTLFTIDNGVTLTLENNITLKGKTGNNSSLIRVNNGGTLIMNTGSRITGNTNSTYHHADTDIGILAGGVFTNGTFIMNGGEIFNNTSSESGSGVYVYGYNSTFTMNGGKIYDNRVFVYNANFTMNGGEISNSGVSVIYSGVFILNNGKITGSNGNSGVSIGGTFIMNDGEISGNYGGGVTLSNNAIFTMKGGKITGNDTHSGGGVNVGGGTFSMTGGEISGNTAFDYFPKGGGVYIQRGTFNKTGGIIYGYNENDIIKSNKVISSGIVENNRGHAIAVAEETFVDSPLFAHRETTVGINENLSYNYNGGASIFSGIWEY